MRTLVLIDGQNLYHLAKAAWHPIHHGRASPYTWPSYDVEKLAHALVARTPGRILTEIRFYTGVPRSDVRPFWHFFWSNKLRYLSSQGIKVYRGSVNAGGQEKGVDVSLALDLVQATYQQRYEVAIIVSRDSDFGPAVRLAKEIAQGRGRRLVFESAFPVTGHGASARRGIPGTTWVHIDKTTYDSCLDTRDYRPRRPLN